MLPIIVSKVKACSPVIDGGNNSVKSPSDFEGSSRFKGTAVDIGAYEPDPACSAGCSNGQLLPVYHRRSFDRQRRQPVVVYRCHHRYRRSNGSRSFNCHCRYYYLVCSQQDAVSCCESAPSLNVVVHATPALCGQPYWLYLSSSSLRSVRQAATCYGSTTNSTGILLLLYQLLLLPVLLHGMYRRPIHSNVKSACTV